MFEPRTKRVGIGALEDKIARGRFGEETTPQHRPARSHEERVTGTWRAIGLTSGIFPALAGILLVGFGGQASLGMDNPYLFQSIAAVVIGGVSILGGSSLYVGAAAGVTRLAPLVSVLLALDMPQYGRSIIYGVVICVLRRVTHRPCNERLK
ncbi:MAG: hypothetical protein ACREFP_01475 [Acetobacteraceae bacterium]